MEKDFEEEQKKQKRKAWLSFATLIGLMIVLLVAAAFVNRYLFYVVIAIYALMVIYAAVQALSSVVDNTGHLKADVLDMANLPKVCGEDMYLTGEGAPAAPPTVPFQEYYDSSSNKFYRAKGVLPDTPSTGDWVALN